MRNKASDCTRGREMRTLNEIDLEHILLGCTVLGTGGGGELKEGLDRVGDDLARGKEFRLLSLSKVPDDALIASPYLCGSLSSPTTEIGAEIQEDLFSFKALQQYLGQDIYATVPTELGGENTASALSVAANMGIPIVDGDPVGRAVPELQHSTFFINQVSIAPMALATKSGDVIIVKNVTDSYKAEKFVRSIAIASDGCIGVTDHPQNGKGLKKSIIAGTLSNAEKIGAVLKRTRDCHEVARAGGGFVVFKGEVQESRWRDDGGFTIGEVHVRGADEYKGKRYKIWFKNEFLMTWRDDAVDITTPDLICVLRRDNAMPITNPNCVEGMHIVVVGLPASEIWRGEKGRATLGPQNFGFDCQYVPIEQKVSLGTLS
jgi:DUF917 family protein